MAYQSILITGATSGIGWALCQYYLAQKSDNQVIAVGRNQQKLAELAALGCKTLSCDLTDRQAVLALNTQLKSYTQQLDLVILNAGTCRYFDRQQQDNLTDTVEFNLQHNFFSMLYSVELVMPFLSEHAQLALMGSMASDFPFQQAQGYGASKAAVAYFAKSLQVDYPNILVQLIQPGFVKTPLTDKNKFNMPFLISQEQAALQIVKGINNQDKLIRFPKRLSFIISSLAAIPLKLQYKLAQKL
ncbi:SDR family NAD(P)-dependent oxidoreductase [Catenovulum sp. 2E275]|uniref:SDR family NAD(P)-dependent oxidoreductase n=1 Tax=Catenovulum sp. 2E275 TaxID=2980497 RepID=UPI0021D1B314|nr:SDR family NAD(P)-dependent oxidoreductase [Catenovulum sp. 2E275]MCU4674633.1 SDR family NAD(P)-dependent oxidoreductase [Catenovulum sp. 2E275]